MANVLAFLVDVAVKRSSAGTLRTLWDNLGASAAAAAADLPRLASALDQHAAAVRDALSAGAGQLGLAALAGYAKGILDGADAPTCPATAKVDWSAATWLQLRLAATALLAHHHGHLPRGSAAGVGGR